MYSANNKIFYKSLKTGKIKEIILSFSASDWVIKTAVVVICLGYSFIPVLGEQASILIWGQRWLRLWRGLVTATSCAVCGGGRHRPPRLVEPQRRHWGADSYSHRWGQSGTEPSVVDAVRQPRDVRRRLRPHLALRRRRGEQTLLQLFAFKKGVLKFVFHACYS